MVVLKINPYQLFLLTRFITTTTSISTLEGPIAVYILSDIFFKPILFKKEIKKKQIKC